MPLSLEQFQEKIRADSEKALKQRYENCRANPMYAEYASLVIHELNARFPGWDRPRIRRGGSRPTLARFKEKEHEFETARAAYIWLVERFASENPVLFTDLRWETTGYVGVGRRRGPQGAARNYFAKAPAKLFRQTPSLADNSNNFHRLMNGWYLNLNLNTRENFDILCRFSAVSKLRYADDWDWEVVDPTEQLSDARQRMQFAKAVEKEINELP